MKLIFCFSLLLIISGCDFGCNKKNNSELDAQHLEKIVVQSAIKSFMERRKMQTINPRNNSRIISTWDTDAPFKSDLDTLPTTYRYSWDNKGLIINVSK